jgi:hypothetical protein
LTVTFAKAVSERERERERESGRSDQNLFKMDEKTVDRIFAGFLSDLPPVSSKIVRIFTRYHINVY